MLIYLFYSELKHLINYKNRKKHDTVSSGERMRYKAEEAQQMRVQGITIEKGSLYAIEGNSPV